MFRIFFPWQVRGVGPKDNRYRKWLPGRLRRHVGVTTMHFWVHPAALRDAHHVYFRPQVAACQKALPLNTYVPSNARVRT